MLCRCRDLPPKIPQGCAAVAALALEGSRVGGHVAHCGVQADPLACVPALTHSKPSSRQGASEKQPNRRGHDVHPSLDGGSPAAHLQMSPSHSCKSVPHLSTSSYLQASLQMTCSSFPHCQHTSPAHPQPMSPRAPCMPDNFIPSGSLSLAMPLAHPAMLR